MKISNINELAWQLRAGVFTLNKGHVELYKPMTQTTDKKGVEIIISRGQRINEIIDQSGLNPSNLQEVIDYFNKLENQNNDNE